MRGVRSRRYDYEESEYDLDIGRAEELINSSNARLVCIQLPSGLKPYAKSIQDELEKRTNAEILIWAGSCFGACDIPLELRNLKVELLIQWGHARWRY
jgi:diphthamide biosynthesis enzyme Dph1/Dph2-like protein